MSVGQSHTSRRAIVPDGPFCPSRGPSRGPLLVLLLGLGTAVAVAEPEPTTPPSDEPAENLTTEGWNDAEALRGPSVPDDDKLSIVSRGMMGGTFRPLRQRPEIAIARRLELDDAVRERIDTIDLARRLQIAEWFARYPAQMRRVQSLLGKGELRDARQLLSEVWETFEPKRPRDPLYQLVIDALPQDERDAFREALNEYWDAWIDDSMSQNPERAGDPQARKARSAGLAVAAVEIEVREITRLTLTPYQSIFEHLEMLQRTNPDAHARAAGLLIKHFRDTRLAATPGQVRVIEREIREATPG